MKRILLVVVSLLLILGTANAAVPDLSGLSSEDLLATIQAAQAALFSAELNVGVKVPQGTYTVGIDIPAGTYRIEIVDGTGYYEVYTDSTKSKMPYAGITGKSYNVTEIGKLELEDGYILKLVNSSFIFFPYVGIFH